MKKGIVFAGVVLVLLIVWSLTRTDDTIEVSPPVETSVPPTTAQPTARVLEKKRAYESPRTVVIDSNASGSAECRNFWSELLKLDLGDERVSKGEATLPSGKGCVTPNDFQLLQKGYEAECLTKNPKLSPEARMQRCHYALFIYRANLHDYLTRDMRLDQISDPVVLVDKLFARFLKNPATAVEVANRLLELYPDYYPAAQTQVFAKLVTYLGKGQKFSPDSPEYNEIVSGVEKLSRMNPDDKQNLELDILLVTLTDGKVEQVREKANEMLSLDPQSSLGAYYLAWAEYQLGNGSEGAKWLNRAAMLDPNDQRIKNTLGRAKANPNFYKSTDPRVKSIFEMKIKTNIDMPYTK